jgi:hypothetical protein
MEEASNPVVSQGIAYTGYTKGSDAVVIAATDNGATLGEPVTVSAPDAHRARHLRLSTVDNRVYAGWQEGSDGEALQMMFAASRDHGLPGSWDAPTLLGPAATDIAQIASDASNVHVAWVMPNDDIVVATSTDSGRRFAAPITLGKGTGEVVVASHGSHVYVAWETGTLTPTRDVMMAVSNDGGKSFPSITDISNNGGSQRAGADYLPEPDDGPPIAGVARGRSLARRLSAEQGQWQDLEHAHGRGVSGSAGDGPGRRRIHLRDLSADREGGRKARLPDGGHGQHGQRQDLGQA